MRSWSSGLRASGCLLLTAGCDIRLVSPPANQPQTLNIIVVVADKPTYNEFLEGTLRTGTDGTGAYLPIHDSTLLLNDTVIAPRRRPGALYYGWRREGIAPATPASFRLTLPRSNAGDPVTTFTIPGWRRTGSSEMSIRDDEDPYIELAALAAQDQPAVKRLHWQVIASNNCSQLDNWVIVSGSDAALPQRLVVPRQILPPGLGSSFSLCAQVTTTYVCPAVVSACILNSIYMSERRITVQTPGFR